MATAEKNYDDIGQQQHWEPIKARPQIFQDGFEEILVLLDHLICLREHFVTSKHRKNSICCPVSLICIVANVFDICSQLSHKS